MQDNIVSNPAALKPGVKQALIRDIKMVHRLRYILRKALEDSPSSLASAITTVWPDLEGQHSRKFSQFKFLHSPNKWWIEIVTAATSESAPQKIHFHLLEGHLLVEYKPLGQLPAEYKSSVMVEQLFGNQTLLTYPSNLPGMAYTLALNMYNHQVHLGFEGKDMIIKAVYRGTILQFIPSEKFYQGAIFDLPGALVFDCIHWIDLKSGTVDVRKKPQIWKPKPSNWTLDFYNRRAYRRTVSLVDPNSDLFRRVSKMFQFFEYPHWLTVFQPEIRPLTVELQRMELSFSVNRRSLLESRQLRSEIDPDQDAKTWYGLKSAIVLRETGLTVDFCHYRYRSVIVPLGPTVTKRDGIHVRVCAENHGDYGRFIINEVLGRIECAPEPRLLYLKAQYHAYTSFVVPDRLTGRTGREECLSLLRSGCYQPWAPLNPISCEILLEIAKLTPERNYYPRGLKAMQRTVWRQELTTTMQSDEMMPAILAIFETSKQLSIFHPQSSEPLPIDHSVDSSLQQRSILRRRLFQCPDDCIKRPSSCDMVYDSRDRRQESQARKNVEVSVKLVSSWPSVMPTTTDLAGILQNWIKITGYTGKSDRILLTDLLTLNFAEEWGPLVELCLSFDTSDVYRLMFLVALISFRQDVNMDIVRTMISFAVLEDLKALAPPKWLTYDAFRYHQIPTASYFQGLMKHALIPFNKDDELLCRLGLTPKQRRRYHGIEDAFESQQQEDSLALASFLFQQWPCQTPKTDGFSRPVLIDVPKALDIIQPDWLRLFQNLELSNYIFLVQRVLDEHRSSGDNDGESHPSKVLVQEILPTRSRVRDILSLPRLLRNSQPIAHDYTQNHLNMKVAQQHVTMPSPMLENKASIRHELCEPTGSTLSRSNEKEELQKIISELIISESTVRQQYGKDLMHSLDALKAQQSLDRIPAFFEPPQLALQITHAQQSILQQFSAICESLHRDDSRKHWLAIGGLWPRVTPITLLERLRSSVAASEFGVGMKNQLIDYAFSITQFQRLLRIEGARQKGNKQRVNEVTNVGHINWDHKSLTDWLLFEIECDIIIRSNQVDVAMATISPASMQNSVVQLNMGEGKTSCIIPMASLVLADKKRLVRVIIPKPLLLQTGQLLHSRLGGLLGREIRHVPYSRRTCGNSDTTKAFRRLHKDIQNSSGVILALPEHILSFRLSGLQKLLDGKIPEAQSLIEAQKYFDDNSRDILDEVDYILAVRTQLIYPSGSQKMVDGHPHRWELIELVLKQVDIHLWNLQRTYPRSIEVVRRAQGGFPLVFFLRKDVEDELISRLVDDIYRGRMSIIPEDSPKSDRLAIQQFIFEAKVTPQLAERITQISSGQQALRKKLLLLRGIFVHRILIMALARRWNVQYGLDARRAANVAVPYHSKSTPSDQAEFGHPDTAIILTILATYYEGLNVNQLFSTLEHVGRSDDPIQIYDSFCQASRTPDSLRDWNRINIGDKLQLNEIWNCLRYQITVVNYYMNNFVFPQHAKNFQLKIQGSGWDIPGRSPSAKSTGFSGTRLKSMLPLTTKQHDLPSLAHTDAEVLTYLLGLRNRRYVRAADPLGRRLSEYELLQMISKMGIRVFIDSGSQILEMSNENLAKSWLEIYHEAPAVLYFRGNSPYILYRNGHQLPLLASPFADDLTDVLVYLDQSHTRGTDLKLPQAAVGAISIGLGQSKDDTTQAAMRLRKLGTSQSVVFLAQPEVHQSILDFRNKTHGDPIDSCDVVHWLLEQTCIGIEKLQPLYYAQGADFCRRTQAALDNPAFLTNPDAREKYLEGIRQSESQTLDQLYGIRTKLKGLDYSGSFLLDLAQHMRDLKTLRNNYQDTSNAVHGSCLQEIEQEREREVAHEVENVRVVQKPVTYLPFPYPGLHRDIELFFKTGRLAADSAAFGHVLSAFRGTNLGRRYGINVFGSTSKLYISAQFTKTVRFPIDASDNFQRCINWLIWSPTTETAMIIIPEEAEGLLRLLREMESSKSHLLTYAAPITRKMLHFNDLTYYSTPALPQNWLPPLWLKVELGIFAGRLYFDHDEYKYLCSYVGVKEHATRLEENEDIASSSGGNNGTPDESERDTGIAEQNQPKIFTRKPLTFIGEWLALKRRGQDYAHTPMGYFCQGKLLTSDHFFFQKQDETPQNTTLRLGPIGTGVNHGREEAEDDGVEAEPFDEDLYGVGGTINEDDKFDDNELYDDTDEEND